MGSDSGSAGYEGAAGSGYDRAGDAHDAAPAAGGADSASGANTVMPGLSPDAGPTTPGAAGDPAPEPAPIGPARPRPEDVSPRRMIVAPFRTGLLAGLGLLLAYALYLSLSTILSTLVVLGISVVLAVGLDPVVRLLMRAGLRRAGAVAITFLGLLAILGGAIYAIIPPIVSQIAALILVLPDRLNALMNDRTVRLLDDRFGIIARIQGYVANLGPGAANGVFTAAGIAVDLLIVLVLTLYFLSGLPRITDAAYRLVPVSRRVRAREIGDMVMVNMGGYLGGATAIALQAGLVAGIFAWIVGLPYPLAIAAGAFVLDFVPVVGPVIIGVSMALLGFTQSLVIGIVAAAFYIGQHLFEAYWLYPKVMRRSVHISTAAVIVAIIVGAALLGVVGAVLAVPVAAALQLIVREVVQPRQDAA
jgi:predicted PurR-regulated permease PerM